MPLGTGLAGSFQGDMKRVMAMTLTTEDKRDLIYVSERLKEIAREMALLRDERAGLRELEDPDEAQKRRRIYATERVARLLTERETLLARRKALTA